MKKHRVFISYCHGIRSQKIVEEVVCALKKRCIEVVYDAELKLGQHLTPFMERIQDPTIDKVLCVVDKKYAEKANERKGGVGRESCIITQTVYEKNQTRIIPIFCNKNKKGDFYAPVFLKDVKGIDFTMGSNREKGLVEIVSNITGRKVSVIQPQKVSQPTHVGRKVVVTYNKVEHKLTVCNITKGVLDNVRVSMEPNLFSSNQGEDEDGAIEIGSMLGGDKRNFRALWTIFDDPSITHTTVKCCFECVGKKLKQCFRIRI